MTPLLRLSDGRAIGPDRPVFVIAEAGVNHNGGKDLALGLVDAAARAGADCVKFQTFSAARVAIRQAAKAPYQQVTTQGGESQIDMLRALELPLDAYPDIQAACRERGLVFLSTPYANEDVDELERLGVDAYKVASAQIIEPDFLAYVAATGKPVLLSTGMATIAEVDDAVRWIRSTNNDQLALLQCTTNYPSDAGDANLRAIQVLRATFCVQTGYSDHTESSTCCIAAVALGATIIEKHITLDKAMPGPDHKASADPAEFRALVQAIREAEMALGSGQKEPTAAELVNRPFMRRSLVAGRAIPAGTVITKEMLAVKRPGSGISPSRIGEVVGTRTRVVLEPDQLIEWLSLER